MEHLPVPLTGPHDIKKMSLVELYSVAEEIRQAIISTCLRNGGHLGASLGTVELALALHYVFDSPQEPILWDVGHQAYAHKLLTGRWERFHTLRQGDGISGFLAREESEHDVFGAGHSSTALSAALGMAYARKDSKVWTTAVVGDGGLTAGVAFEALNNASGIEQGPLLLVLNDNQMSISQNVGALSQIFATGQTRQFFELFGFEYAGPVDGHDLGTLIGALQAIRAGHEAGKPVILHVLTQKGKGYTPAEESPAAYHGISPVVEKVAGKPAAPKLKTYSEVFGEALCALAAKDPKIVAITAAMPEGTGLTEFARRFPERFFDVGIAEPHAVTFAAGLATQGFKPVVAIYSTFLQRALDAIIHDVALQNLGVTFAIDRAGLVGADGPTHHGMFDLAYLGMIPQLSVSAPSSQDDLARELEKATSSGRPWAIRYPRGSGPATLEPSADKEGVRWHQIAKEPRIVVIALGSAAMRAVAAAKAVDPGAEKITVVSVVSAKPVAQTVLHYADAHPGARLLTVEDGIVRGGFGQAVLTHFKPRSGGVEALGYPDGFVPHGAPAALDELTGLSVSALTRKLQSMLASQSGTQG
jgi:1-deoxy-D-xylulose-5-phosphate synthase